MLSEALRRSIGYKFFTTTLISSAALLTLVYRHIESQAQKLPDIHPGNFTKKGPTLVCIGDSLTHGRVSHNYVEMLDLPHLDIVNAGINSELAWNVRQRIDAIIACQPDFITILIGSNDAKGILSDTKARQVIRDMGLPQRPDIDWFRQNLSRLCRQLQDETGAKIALLSLPPIGEDEQKQSTLYSRVIKEVAAAQNLDYLPLNETMCSYLEQHPNQPGLHFKGHNDFVMKKAIAMHFLGGRSFDEIACYHNLQLTTDLVHLNSRGARMVADLIQEWVRSVDR